MRAFQFRLLVAFLAGFATLSSGCVIWNLGPGSTPPALGYSHVESPNSIQRGHRRELQYDPSLIEFVGWVQTEQESLDIRGRFNAVGVDDSDYGSGFNELRETYKLDGILSASVDTRRWVLNFYFFRISSYDTIISGLGYRYKRPLHEWPTLPDYEYDDEGSIDIIGK
jgi:hypothetical protein